MPSQPESLAELFRSLDLTLTIRSNKEEEEAWACLITRPDGRTYEIEMVSFFDVDPETGEEWPVEPTPTRVLSVMAGTEVESEDEDDETAGRRSGHRAPCGGDCGRHPRHSPREPELDAAGRRRTGG